jgi:hypothetical protein
MKDVYRGSRILIFTHPGSRIPDPKTVPKKFSICSQIYGSVERRLNRFVICQGFLKDSVADPDPGSGIGYIFDPGIWDGRKSASGSGIRDEQPGSYFWG